MSTKPYANLPLTRAEVDAISGPCIVDFGTHWCGHCNAALPLLAEVLKVYPQVQHIKVEDGSGRRLGRTFRVKLWPTLVFMRDGQEVVRLVRPTQISDIQAACQAVLPRQ